jgi:imidazolonepropionase-like amidohydrolase
MVRAGLTPMETLVAATSSSARLLRRDKDLGSVQTGKAADLVLLDANPAENIANTQRINAVVLNGRLMDRKTLDGLLAQMAVANATN